MKTKSPIFPVMLLLTCFGITHAQEVQRIKVGDLQTNCYFLINRSSGRSIVIDPGAEGSRIKKTAREGGFEISAIFLTHAHHDHTGACESLQTNGIPPVYVHPDDLAAAGALIRNTKITPTPRNGPMEIDGFRLEIIPVPGHSPGSICIRWGNHLFTGDTLFAGTIGRNDDDHALCRLIRERLLVLSDELPVHPGHGEQSTIGAEKRTNPYVALETAPAHASSIDWIENYQEALKQAEVGNRIIFMLITVQQWPCARSYCENIGFNQTIRNMSRQTVNCMIDRANGAQLLQRFNIRNFPAVLFLNREGQLLDLLEKVSEETIERTMIMILKGEQPFPEFVRLEKKPDKTAEELLYMAGFHIRHGRDERALVCLEQILVSTNTSTATANSARRELISIYDRLDRPDSAIGHLDRLLPSLQATEMPTQLLIRCSLLYKSKKYEETLAEIQKLQNKYAGTPEAERGRVLRGLCFLSLGNNEAAVHSFHEARQAENEATRILALYLEGYAELIQQHYVQARKCFETLLTSYPDSKYANEADQYVKKLANMPDQHAFGKIVDTAPTGN